jgi:hypothetical protein
VTSVNYSGIAATSASGIGLAFNPVLEEFVTQHEYALDFLEISPERFWHDRGPAYGQAPGRYMEIPEAISQLEAARGNLPLVAHGVGLSIATTGPLDIGHINQLARWCERYEFDWLSEHLAYFRLGPESGWRGIGVMIPPVYDEAVLVDLEVKVQQVCEILGIEFLLENAVNFTPVHNPEYTEAEFLQAVATRTQAKLLLDLHNLHTNAVNHGWDPLSVINAIDLTLVRELHIAGGEPLVGQWTDAHSGRCAPEVWPLLEYVLSRPNGVQAVTLEIDESYAALTGYDVLLEEISRAREIWDSAQLRLKQHVG